MIESTWLVENIVRLNGPIDPIFHLYDRNVKSLALIERCLDESMGIGLVEKITQSYLEHYCKEYLRTLFEFISASLMSLSNQLKHTARVIRRSRHYLPHKVVALGQLIQSKNFNFDYFFVKWLSGKLQQSFSQHKSLFTCIFDSASTANYQHYVLPLVKKCTNLKISPKSELERTDSYTQLRHMSCLSRKCGVDSPDSTSDSSSSSKTQSPVFSELPNQPIRECCPNYAHHQFVVLSWLRENQSNLKYKDSKQMERDLEKLIRNRSAFSKSEPFRVPLSSSRLPKASSSGLERLKVQSPSRASVSTLIINQ